MRFFRRLEKSSHRSKHDHATSRSPHHHPHGGQLGVEMKTLVDGQKFASQHFRLRKGENSCGEVTIWLDIWGNSYAPAAHDRRGATETAKQLRLAADWLDQQKLYAFRKRSK